MGLDVSSAHFTTMDNGGNILWPTRCCFIEIAHDCNEIAKSLIFKVLR